MVGGPLNNVARMRAPCRLALALAERAQVLRCEGVAERVLRSSSYISSERARDVFVFIYVVFAVFAL